MTKPEKLSDQVLHVLESGPLREVLYAMAKKIEALENPSRKTLACDTLGELTVVPVRDPDVVWAETPKTKRAK